MGHSNHSNIRSLAELHEVVTDSGGILVLPKRLADLVLEAAKSTGNLVSPAHHSIVESRKPSDEETVLSALTLRPENRHSPAAASLAAKILELAGNDGLPPIDENWFKHLQPGDRITMSKLGLDPMRYGWAKSCYQFPGNRRAQERASTGISLFINSKNPEDLNEVAASLLSDGGKGLAGTTQAFSCFMATWEINPSQWLRENPGDVKGALTDTAQRLFLPWRTTDYPLLDGYYEEQLANIKKLNR